MWRDAAAFLLAGALSLVLMPLAIRAGHRAALLDHPQGWKRQARPTPYTGGLAVMAAFLLATVALSEDLGRVWPLLALAPALGVLGMLDDRRRVPASVRVAAEIGAAALLWAAGLGWSIFSSDAANLALTALWVLGLVNATNLLDLMDGVAATVAAVCAAGVGVLAGLGGDMGLAVLAFALAGACAGFLRENLRAPARVYLGDGGTMAIGFALAATVAALPFGARQTGAVLLGAPLLFGVPLFDMALRIALRRRRGISLLTGGHDSVANWLQSGLGSPRLVAAVLGAAQALLCGVAVAALRLSDEAVVAVSAAAVVVALGLAAVIVRSPWAREADARARPAPAPEEVGRGWAPVVVITPDAPPPLPQAASRPAPQRRLMKISRQDRPQTRYLVTGGAGFIGSTLVDALVARGDRVLVLDDLSTGSRDNIAHRLDRPALRFARNVDRTPQVEFIEGSVLDEDLVDQCMRSVDHCLHLASAVGVQLVVSEPLESLLRNVRGNDVVISAAARHQRPLLFASTSEIYGKNSAPALTEDSDRVLGSPFVSRWSYSTAKAFGEALASAYHREQGAQNTVVRLFNTVGPRQTGAYGMVLPRFVRQALAGDDLTVYGTGRQSRCFVHVRDVVEAIVLLCDSELSRGRAFNVGSFSPVTILDLAGKVIERAGSSSRIRFVAYEEAYGSGFEDLPQRRPDCSRLTQLTGWRPTRSLEDAIDDVIAHERASAEEADTRVPGAIRTTPQPSA